VSPPIKGNGQKERKRERERKKKGFHTRRSCIRAAVQVGNKQTPGTPVYNMRDKEQGKEEEEEDVKEE
jgi:hypothetical protein